MTGDRTRRTPALLAEDALVFGLRMNSGVDLSLLRGRCPAAPWDRVESLFDRLAAEDLAAREGSWVRLLPKGRLLGDAIGTEVMIAFDPPVPAPAGVA
jgi:oxygen-independent coproporphyrinogen-3 oxidase